VTRPGLIALLGILTALVLAALVWWLSQEFEIRQERRPMPWQGEAASNRYLAAQRLLERYGARVETPLRYVAVPPAGASLVLPQTRFEMSLREAAAIHAWVDAGGQLVVQVRVGTATAGTADDPLLNGLPVHGEIVRDGAPEPGGPPAADAQTCRATLPGGAGQLRLAPSSLALVLDSQRDLIWRLDQCGRTRAARFRSGEGSITVLADSSFMVSRQLDLLDHAGYLVWLLAPQPARSIWIIQGGSSPPLWQRLFAALPAASVGVLLCLVCALWRAGPAPGPRLPVPEGARRSLLEHVAASGWLLWQIDRGALLYAALCGALLRRAAVRHPSWHELGEAQRARRAAELASLPERDVARALSPNDLRQPDDFIRDFRILETLRKLL
jgi:hypothetical protein